MQIGDLTAFLSYIMQILFSVMMAVMMFVMVPRAAALRRTDQDGARHRALDPRPGDPSPLAARAAAPSSSAMSPSATPAPRTPCCTTMSFTCDARARPPPIVGSTGSGKTTLVNLIPRLYDVTGGAVLVDGVDVRDLAQEDLWGRIGLVPQRAFLFSGTVAAATCASASADATDDELWHALEVAQAARLRHARWPDGLDSADRPGRHERLGRAAAAARDRPRAGHAVPAVYLFDDSFSALDCRHRRAAASRAARPRPRDATVLIVAQRVSTILHADQIVVLDDGRMSAPATHSELLDALRDLPRDRRLAAHARRRLHERAAPRAVRVRASGRRFGRPGGGGPMGMGMGLPAEKTQELPGLTLRRCSARLRPERSLIAVRHRCWRRQRRLRRVGPKLLGNATNVIFEGSSASSCRPASPRRRPMRFLRANGQGQQADMLSGMTVTPGEGIDFSAARQTSSLIVAFVYLLSSLFCWAQQLLMAGVTQRTDVPTARGGRPQARPAAAEVLRQPRPRRPAEPGHQRHRQHRARRCSRASPSSSRRCSR